MRYAIVIEKAEGNYRPMCRTCRAALSLVIQSSPLKPKSAMLFASTLMG